MTTTTGSDYKHQFGSFTMIVMANLAAMGVNLATGLYLVRQFEPEEYGRLIFLLASFGIFRMLATFGLGNRITLDTALSLRREDSTALNQTFYSLLLVRAGALAVFVILSAIFAFNGNSTYYFVGLMLAPTSLQDHNLAVLQGNQKSIPISLVIISQPLTYTLLVFSLITRQPKLEILYYSLIASYVVSFLVSYILIRRLGIRSPRKIFISLNYIRDSLKFVGNSYIIVIVMYVFSVTSTYLLGVFHYFDEAAKLGVVLTLVSLPTSMIQLALASLFQSKFMQIYASDGALSATQYLKEFSLMIYRLLVGVAGISMFFAATIVWVLYGNAYTDSATALVILGPSMISSVVQSIFIFTLTLVSANSGRTNYRS